MLSDSIRSAPADGPSCGTPPRCARRPRRPSRRILVLLPVLLLITVAFGTGAILPAPAVGLRPSSLAASHTVPNALAAASASLDSGHGPGARTHWNCPTQSTGTIQCTSATTSPGARASVSSGWIPATTLPGGQGSVGLLVYDARDGYDLLMSEGPSTNASAGWGSPPVFFLFENGVWSSPTVSGGPAFCGDASLTYDSTDQLVVYLGGLYCTSAGDTWTYQSGVWANITLATAHPPTVEGASVSDDPGVAGLLWFGGCCSSSSLVGTNWTWKFAAANGNWSNVSAPLTSRPTGEWYGSMAYDAADAGVVLVSGATAASWQATYTTWFFNGTWHSEAKVPVGNARLSSSPGALADYAPGGYVVLVPAWNGTNTSGVSFHYKNGSWTSGTPHPGLSETRYPAMAYDAARSADLLLDGAGTSCCPAGTTYTWSYSGQNWTNLSATSTGPSSRADIAITYDAADGYVVAFGGCACSPNSAVTGVQSETWKFSAGNWSQLATNVSPPARSQAGLVYDAVDGYVLMFGGQGSSGTYNDTWEFTAGGWSPITPVASPPWYAGETMAYDGADNYVVLLTGWFPASTWTYHSGVWTNRTALGDRSIDGAPANPVVYDSTDQYVLLFGTAHTQAGYSPYLASSTWTFRGGNWTNATSTVGTPPPSRGQASVADFPPGGLVIVYGGSQDWGALVAPRNDTWAFGNGSWTHLAPAISPGNRSDMFGAYDPAALADVFFGGWYGQSYPSPTACSYDGPCGDTWYWSGGSLSSPLIQVFSATPSVVDLGSTTRFSVSVIGGTTPFSYLYTGLPTGCATANASALACTPMATGAWTVTVRVSDAGGHATTAQTLLTVAPTLTISAFFATPNATAVAERTLLSVQTSHGTPPFTYAFSGLPPGCPSQDVPTLPCTPAGAGNFTLRVQVHDAGGANASASLTLPVTSSGTSGSLRITGFRIAPSTIVLGNSSTVSVNATASNGPLGYAYGNLPPGCSSSNASSLACTPTSAGTYGISISVRDPVGDFASVSGNLTVDPVGGGAGLSISGFGASPGRTPVGSTVVLSVVATGGVGPLSYRYPSLPSGCVSANISALPCAPTAPGTYQLYVIVSDAAAHSTGAVGSLAVEPSSGPAPSVSAFFASPRNVTLGNATTLIVEARGTLPFAYAYRGLPPGCTTANAGILNCTSTDVGTFRVTVSVTDAGGRSAWGNASFLVVAAGPGPKGPTNPIVTSASGEEPVLLWALIGVVVGAAVSLAALELYLARRRLREDGEAIVRELSRRNAETPATPPDRSGP